MNPQIPNGNQNQFFGQKVSKAGINVNNASESQLIYKNDFNSTIYYNASGIPTVLTGLRAANPSNGIGTNQQGFFVSKPGFNVINATDSQLIFNSSNDTFKIVQTGNINLTTTSITGAAGFSFLEDSIVTPHGLSFIPAVIAYINLGSLYIPMPYTALNVVGGNASWQTFYVEVDATNITFLIRTMVNGAITVSSAIRSMKYYLLQETAN